MAKELVISATSHERRVAILEEGQLVEIYIEREKEFALVGSIYKGKVTRVLPGMQSAFVDIGLDGDAFLYVSDVFENLEDYDHGHAHTDAHTAAAAPAFSPAPPSDSVELLPGETLARASSSHEHEEEPTHEAHGEDHTESSRHEELHHDEHHEASHDESSHRDSRAHDVQPGAAEEPVSENEIASAHTAELHDDAHHNPEERQPESNASAPQNFSPHYNPTQNYAPRSSGGGQNFGRGGDRGSDRGGSDRSGGSDRGGDRGRGRFGRRGGRHRGGRPQGPAVGGRNLPPSKYASPQGGESRGNEPRGFENRGRDQRGSENRGGQPRGFEPRGPAQRGFDHRPPDAPHATGSSAPVDAAAEPILLPGESLAKYRGKPLAAAPPPPVVEPEYHEPQPEVEEQPTPRAAGNIAPATGPGSSTGANVPRRFSGGLPRWLLADSSSESEAAPVSADENIGVADDSSLSAHGANPPRHEASPLELPSTSASDSAAAAPREALRAEPELNDQQAASLAFELAEAKHEETSDHAKVDALVGGAEFDEDDVEEVHAAAETELSEEEAEEEDRQEEAHLDAAEDQAAAETELSEDETEEVEEHRAANRAEFEANAAHESAEHAAALGDSVHIAHDHAEHEHHEHSEHEPTSHEHASHEHAEAELIEAHAGESAPGPAVVEDDVILLPGETRAPRIGGAAAPREDFPRDSARIGGNPRARFQRPQRGGRDRDRGRGGRPDSRSGRPDRGPDRGSDRPPDRGPDRGRPSGPRFERRPS